MPLLKQPVDTGSACHLEQFAVKLLVKYVIFVHIFEKVLTYHFIQFLYIKFIHHVLFCCTALFMMFTSHRQLTFFEFKLCG